jgi:hypothetical protein
MLSPYLALPLHRGGPHGAEKSMSAQIPSPASETSGVRVDPVAKFGLRRWRSLVDVGEVVQRLGGVKQHREQEDHRLVTDGSVDSRDVLVVE